MNLNNILSIFFLGAAVTLTTTSHAVAKEYVLLKGQPSRMTVMEEIGNGRVAVATTGHERFYGHRQEVESSQMIRAVREFEDLKVGQQAFDSESGKAVHIRQIFADGRVYVEVVGHEGWDGNSFLRSARHLAAEVDDFSGVKAGDKGRLEGWHITVKKVFANGIISGSDQYGNPVITDTRETNFPTYTTKGACKMI